MAPRAKCAGCSARMSSTRSGHAGIARPRAVSGSCKEAAAAPLGSGKSRAPPSVLRPPDLRPVLGVTVARDLVCLSHLRWDFVYQRPNHLMARAARDRRVFFIEEPIFEDRGSMSFEPVERDGVQGVTPRLPAWDAEDPQASLKRMIDGIVWQYGVDDLVLWYYTPMALPWTDHLARSATVFDCMDHLAGFKGAPAGLLTLEMDLLRRADLVL